MHERQTVRTSAGAQTVLAVGSGLIVLVMLLSARTAMRTAAPAPVPQSVTIGVEHSSRCDISVTASKDATPGLLQIRSNGTGTVILLLPLSAELREVRGMLLSAVKKEQPQFGYRRWQLPAGVTFSFSLPTSPSSLSVQTPSDAPMLLKTRSIELKTGKVEDESTLLQKGQTVVW